MPCSNSSSSIAPPLRTKIRIRSLLTLIGLIFSAAIPGPAMAQAPAMPKVVISTAQSVYHKGEEIILEATLNYAGDIPMQIAIPLFSSGHGLAITNTGGEPLLNLAFIKPSQKKEEINNGANFTDAFTINTTDWQPGQYTIQYTLLVTIAAKDDPSPKDPTGMYSDVVGYVNSDPIKIEIID